MYISGMQQSVRQSGWQSVSEAVGSANLFVSIAATKVWARFKQTVMVAHA